MTDEPISKSQQRRLAAQSGEEGDLVRRLRTLAGKDSWPAPALLREAADALEERHALACTNARMVEAAWKERDDLKAKLAEAQQPSTALPMFPHP